MRVTVYVPNTFIDRFLENGYVPEGQFVWTYIPSFEPIGSHTQVLITGPDYLFYKQNNMLKYNLGFNEG